MGTTGDSEMVPMRDHEKAAAGAGFKISKQKLIDLCDMYKKRKYVEELDCIV